MSRVVAGVDVQRAEDDYSGGSLAAGRRRLHAGAPQEETRQEQDLQQGQVWRLPAKHFGGMCRRNIYLGNTILGIYYGELGTVEGCLVLKSISVTVRFLDMK